MKKENYFIWFLFLRTIERNAAKMTTVTVNAPSITRVPIIGSTSDTGVLVTALRSETFKKENIPYYLR